ncbi:kinase-like protein [Marasmius fiardii PR-910]|nr:kinase-like protein [Marasmius fiardii PR-910]
MAPKSDIIDNALRIVESVVDDEEQARKLLEYKGEDAQMWLDALQLLTDLPEVETKLRSSMYKIMLHLSKRSGLCPRTLMIENVTRLGDNPVDWGGFGLVWKGRIGISKKVVCLKVVKIYTEASDVQRVRLLAAYMQEAIVWQQLKHPNVLPFIGMYYLNNTQEQLCLISPWMDDGNLSQFVKKNNHIDHYSLAYDVAAGLHYLHSKKIVHGDLKAVNVLITPDERACIGDFGLSRIADTQAIRLTSSTTSVKGSERWLSPELLMPDPSCAPSTSSDIYAYGCVCYEIFTQGNVPFHELRDAAVVLAVVINKRHPLRPEQPVTPLTDEMWNIMVSCWNFKPRERPTAPGS